MLCTNKHLLLFTRYPEPGSTKTGLIPKLGEEGAANLQKKLTEHIFTRCLSLLDQGDLALTLHYCGGDEHLFRNWLGQAVCYRKQVHGDIGRRMYHAFTQTFAEGGEHVVLIGSDVPAISVEILHQAFSLLPWHDVVLGPAADGGYYLIGLNRSRGEKLLPHLFSKIPWSTEKVYIRTMDILRKFKVTVAELPVLRDIDRPEDLEEAGRWIAL